MMCLNVIFLLMCMLLTVVSVFFLQSVMTKYVLSELIVQLGLCEKGSPEIQHVTQHYLTIMEKLKVEKMRGTGGSHCWAKVNFSHS